ncbi:receptor-transporting protein 2 [Nothobranchius furzeri]|uniref:Receptor-transporting protein 3-like n=3 Tax=Nothobranchius TaxID=28779 RepID=A0A9D2XZX0_NOTFU|nr:receptor-transporting protein 3 [Nothobranchius furzeri]KAF7211591.1 receptor-transporting protein 3-like [Nothobranchius furzeri]
MARPTEWTPSLWQDTFNELLDDEVDYDDDWNINFNYTLNNKVSPEERKRGWKVFCHCARGKFYCRTCRRSWPSGRVTVLFRYRLRNGRGTVLMRPFGQDCRRCQEGFFDFPGFSERAVEEALLKLFSKIRKNCYGEDDGSDRGSTASDKVWTKPHEKALCEACQQGICDQDDDSEC